MRVPVLALLTLVALSACRSGNERAQRTALLLQSTDRIAIYDAGVQAYRAKEFSEARQLWRRAADLGDHSAASNIGFLLYYGYGGPADSAGARVYWTRAVAQGDAEAHRHIADAILDGDAYLGTDAEAYGHAFAASHLARLPGELESRGVAADANRLVRKLQSRLSRTEQARGDSLSRNWIALGRVK